MTANIDFKPLTLFFSVPNVENAKDVVHGRDFLVNKLWKKLESSSVKLISERRIGKTCVMKLAIALKPDWALEPLYFDSESVKNATEFVHDLNKALHEANLINDTWWQKVSDWFRRVLHKLQAAEISNSKLPKIDSWKSLLEDTCKTLENRSKKTNKTTVLMIDELPYTLDKFIKQGESGYQEAVDILDALRKIRQERPFLKTVFCGSLGMHVIMQRLKEKGYSGQPVNDMETLEVPALDQVDAINLAGGLLIGEEIGCSDIYLVAELIAKFSSSIPFYIQKVISWMRDNPTDAWSSKLVENVIESMFNASGDPGEFSYYEKRISQYYSEAMVEKAKISLDILSRHCDGLDFNKLLNFVRHNPKTQMIDPESIVFVLNMLKEDHYLLCKDDIWSFKFSIVRNWWFIKRGRLEL